MSKKQFDHIEDRIREAAENSEISFDALAWQKMEAKLDEEKGDKRRFFAWWIVGAMLILSISVAGYFILANNSPKKVIAANEVAKKEAAINNKLSILNKNNTQNKKIGIAPDKLLNPANGQISSVATDKNLNSIPAKKTAFTNDKYNYIKDKISLQKVSKKTKTYNEEETIIPAENIFVNNKLNAKQSLPTGKTKGKVKVSTNGNNVADVDADNNADKNEKNNNLVINSITPKNDNNKVSDINAESTEKNVIIKDTARQDKKLDSNKISKIKTDKTSIVKNTKSKPGKPILSRFYLLASGGADAAGLKLFSVKKNTVTPRFGVGVGFELNNKISLQTGFYASRKKYIAGPDDYNAKKGSYWSTVKILKVDASCLVYEIPLAVRFNILQKNSFTLFATGGLSSFIMKKEDYNYHYIHDNAYHEMSKSYTGNKNFFSIASFSVGLEKRLSPSFSIIAEPSVSMPIMGVGDGRVKLYSTALQLGFKYQLQKKLRKK